MALATATTPSPTKPIISSRSGTGIAVGLLVLVDALAMTLAIARFGELTTNTTVLIGLTVWALALGGHYRLRLDLSVLDDMVGIAGRIVATISLGAAYRELVSGQNVFTVDRLWVLVGAVAFVLIGRAGVYAVVRVLRQRGHLRRPTVLVAPADAAVDIEDAIAADPACGLVPIGSPRPLPDSPYAMDLNGAEVVIVAVTEATRQDTTELVRHLAACDTEVYLLPTSLAHYAGAVPGADQVSSLPLLPVRPAVNRSVRWKLKRVIDVTLVVALLPIAAPVVAIAALALAREGGSDVLYRQERIGLGGRRFTMYKLRTIPAGPIGIDQTWSVDPATIRPAARFCRSTSVDELPQLWNVLIGDMSLVGPRPERPQYAKQFAQSIPDYANRHRVRSGLTGLAQVNGLRGDTSIAARARADNSYIDNWSLFQDLKILCRTVTSFRAKSGSSATSAPAGGLTESAAP